MSLFDEKGCLTDEALRGTVKQAELTELQRLEISEHLSFCDSCLERYSLLLTEDVLVEPQNPVSEKLRKRLHKKVERFLFHRVTAAALAACLALAFLFSDAFTMSLSPGQSNVPFIEATQRISEGSCAISNQLFDTLDDWNQQLFSREGQRERWIQQYMKNEEEREPFHLFRFLDKGAKEK